VNPWLPNQSTALVKSSRGGVLRIKQNFGIGSSWRNVDGDVSFLAAHTARTPQEPISHNAVADAVKTSQLSQHRRSLQIDVYMNNVAGWIPVVLAYRNRRLQIFETSQTHGLEVLPDGREKRRQRPGDTSKGAALMSQVNGFLWLLCIERPPIVRRTMLRST